jgi:hypothetical protein
MTSPRAGTSPMSDPSPRADTPHSSEAVSTLYNMLCVAASSPKTKKRQRNPKKTCRHGTILPYCLTCKQAGVRGAGTSICEHGTRKSRCKKCGGSELCPHGKRCERSVKDGCQLCKQLKGGISKKSK